MKSEDVWFLVSLLFFSVMVIVGFLYIEKVFSFGFFGSEEETLTFEEGEKEPWELSHDEIFGLSQNEINFTEKVDYYLLVGNDGEIVRLNWRAYKSVLCPQPYYCFELKEEYKINETETR